MKLGILLAQRDIGQSARIDVDPHRQSGPTVCALAGQSGAVAAGVRT
jgi:hypothetical protein